MGDDHGGGGFALDEYLVPRAGFTRSIEGGTIAKDSLEKVHNSNMLQVMKQAGTTPSPDTYYKDIMDKSFSTKSRGGTFCKLPRDARSKMNKNPAVGQYATECALLSPRTLGGSMAKSPRGNWMWNNAQYRAKSLQAPGKYDAISPELHKPGLTFLTPRTEGRGGKKPQAPGPGQYNMIYATIETSVPSYSSRKEPSKSFIDDLQKIKAKLPAPGHCGIPFSKAEDTDGRKRHVAKLLLDRSGPVTARPGYLTQ